MGYIHFFDDWQLMSYHNLERIQGQPSYVPEATLEDELTEGTWNFPLVVRIPENGKYIGLYGAAVSLPEKPGNAAVPAGVDTKVRARTQILCYAESDDGIRWTCPDLTDKANFKGPVFAKNQVFGLGKTSDGMPPYYDIYESDPNKRFKYLINYEPDDMDREVRALCTSPDGIRWTVTKEFRSLEGTDTPTSIFYHPGKKVYVFNVRKWKGDRRIFFFETTDWKNFSQDRLVMHPDPLDEKLVGFYGMPVVRYENIFVGLLWKIYCDPFTNLLPNGAIDCELCYSYDGEHFNRTYRKPFIKRNQLGDHGGGCIYVSSMVIDEDNNIRFYSGASKAEHFQNQELKDAALMMHKMRLDGFMYMATPSGRGTLLTRPLYIQGDDLRINAKTPWGQIRVRILDENGKVIPGYDFKDCIPLQGDELFWNPCWKNGKTFGTVKSHKRRQLEFEIITGHIYGIRGDFEILKCLWYPDKKQSGNC